MVVEINIAEIPESSRKSSKVEDTVNQLLAIPKGKALLFSAEDGKPQTIILRVKKANESGLLGDGVKFVAKRRTDKNTKAVFVAVHKKE